MSASPHVFSSLQFKALQVDDYTFELTNKLKGQVLTTQRTVISKDGKSRTNTISGKNAQGVTVNNTQLYEKQEP